MCSHFFPCRCKALNFASKLKPPSGQKNDAPVVPPPSSLATVCANTHGETAEAEIVKVKAEASIGTQADPKSGAPPRPHSPSPNHTLDTGKVTEGGVDGSGALGTGIEVVPAEAGAKAVVTARSKDAGKITAPSRPAPPSRPGQPPARPTQLPKGPLAPSEPDLEQVHAEGAVQPPEIAPSDAKCLQAATFRERLGSAPPKKKPPQRPAPPRPKKSGRASLGDMKKLLMVNASPDRTKAKVSPMLPHPRLLEDCMQ